MRVRMPFYVMTPEIEQSYLTWLRWYQIETSTGDSGVLRQAYLGGRLDMLEEKETAETDAAQARQRIEVLEAALKRVGTLVDNDYCWCPADWPFTAARHSKQCQQARSALIAAPTSPAAAGAGTHRKQ